MAESASPQLQAVGEPPTNLTYASLIHNNSSHQPLTKTILKPIEYIHGEPTIKFTMEELDSFSTEEGLHQAVIMKFAHNKPDFHEIRKNIPKQFGIEGRCNIGQLEVRHLLLRLTPSLFAKKSLLSMASAAGKPLAVDKATQERSRPNTARVKVILDLLDKHPKRIRLFYVDEKSGKVIEHYQDIVYDNFPKYCTCCKHQGHDESVCRLRLQNQQNDVLQHAEHENKERANGEKYQGDLRQMLNEKRMATSDLVTRDASKTDLGVPTTADTRKELVEADATKTNSVTQGNKENNNEKVVETKNNDGWTVVTYKKLAGIRIGSPSKANRPTPQVATVSNHQEAEKTDATCAGLALTTSSRNKEFQLVNEMQACDSRQRTNVGVDNKKAVKVVAQVEKSGQQLVCKEALKKDGMAGARGSAAKNNSAAKANRINSNALPVGSIKNAFQAIAGDYCGEEVQGNEKQLEVVDDPQLVVAEDVQDVAQVTSLSPAIAKLIGQDSNSNMKFKSIGVQILENMNPLHTLPRNLLTNHDTNQSKGNLNATGMPIPVLNLGTMNTSTQEEKQGETSAPRWAGLVEEEKHITPPPRSKLSPQAPVFAPSNKTNPSMAVIGTYSNLSATKVRLADRDILHSLVSHDMDTLNAIDNSKKSLAITTKDMGVLPESHKPGAVVSGFSPNTTNDIDLGDDMFDGDDEDDMLDMCFDKLATDGDLSPRQQRSGSNKSKKKTHGRQHSWDGKVTGEFVPRHLPMQLAKQNHMTVSTTLTRSNKSKKK